MWNPSQSKAPAAEGVYVFVLGGCLCIASYSRVSLPSMTAEEDALLAKSLATDEKDFAENLMVWAQHCCRGNGILCVYRWDKCHYACAC